MISISIVEDHDNYRLSLVRLLEADGRFLVKGIYSYAELALEGLQNDPVDIAIVDIMLKQMSGIELVRLAKPKAENTQFLMCTSYQDSENVFNALRAGACGYIVKDASASEIINAIVDLHQGGSPMSPYIARKVINLLGRQPESNMNMLTPRELQVLMFLSDGLLYKEISDTLSISLNTVKNHLKNIYKKLHVQNKVEAVNKYRAGI